MFKYSICLNKDPNLITYINQEACIGSVMVGNYNYALRISANYTIDDLLNLQSQINKEIIVVINKLFHNSELANLAQYLKTLAKINIKTIMIADLGIINLLEQLHLSFNIIYNTETTITNHYFTTMHQTLGYQGIELAKEITLAEIKTILDYKASLIGISGHGQIYMFYSMRHLLSNYQTVISEKFDPQAELYLYDQERECYYPIVENEQGTHILASKDICIINKLDDFYQLDLDYIKLDSFLYKESDFLQIVKLYVKAYYLLIDDITLYKQEKQALLKAIKTLVPYKEFSHGFFYKKTIYKD